MAASLDIRLKRANKIYKEGVRVLSRKTRLSGTNVKAHMFNLQEDLCGVVVFDCKTESRHEGITLTVEGFVNMQLSSKNVGIFEAFYNSVKVSCKLCGKQA